MRLALIISFFFVSLFSFSQKWLNVKANSGDNRILLLKKYSISDQCSKDKFLILNQMNSADFLIKGKVYKLPIKEFDYNGKSIRSTISISNYNQAKSIQLWNETIVKNGVKQKKYSSGGKLWVPHYLLDCYQEKKTLSTKNPVIDDGVEKVITHEIFGEKYKKVKIVSNKLKGRVYYLVSGHGGPDPGAVGECQGKSICEDEYAYDITLRLGRDLVAEGAIVYMIVRDENDGIRDLSLLKCDKDEVTYPKQKIPLNQVKRLNQRVNAINVLYKKHKKQGVSYQRMIIVHIDSRNIGSRVDMFFYYFNKSKVGKKVAETLYSTVRSKYDKYQKGRGYKGTVKPRNLHVLRKSSPTGVYIELGNIQNPKDQKRFTVVDNRDAIAKWFKEALLKKP